MTNFKWLASLVLATAVASTLGAETPCPGNLASVPFHVVNRHQIIVAVTVNHSGPYNFLLEAGTPGHCGRYVVSGRGAPPQRRR